MVMNWVLAAHAPQVLGEPRHVHVVQGGFNLVQHAEGRRVDPHNGKVDGDGHQGLLPAGEGLDVGDDLPRRVDLDLNAGGEHVAVVGEGKLRRAAAEQLPEDLRRSSG